MMPWMRKKPPQRVNGFTLVEMLAVLTILAVMTAVAVPYAGRSNGYLLLEGECRSLAETMSYAVDLAARTRRPTQIVVDLAQKTCVLEIARDQEAREYALVEDGQPMALSLSEKTQVLDLQGFQSAGSTSYSLTVHPGAPWPSAAVTLAVDDALRKIVLLGGHVAVEDSSN